MLTEVFSRHNKFATELARQMAELGIEGPRAGQNQSFPMYLANIQQPPESSEQRQWRGSSPSAQVQRRRASSRAAVIDSGPGFEDVYEGRKPPERLRSIHEPRDEDRLASPVERRESRRSGSIRFRGFLPTRQGTTRGNNIV